MAVSKLAALIEKNSPAKGPRCAAGKALGQLTEEDRRTVEDALAKGVTVASVARALREMGIDMPYSSLQRHYRKDCLCERVSC